MPGYSYKQNTYFVAKNGSNSNDGRDELFPLLTITEAISKVIAGGKIKVLDSQTYTENLTINKNLTLSGDFTLDGDITVNNNIQLTIITSGNLTGQIIQNGTGFAMGQIGNRVIANGNVKSTFALQIPQKTVNSTTVDYEAFKAIVVYSNSNQELVKKVVSYPGETGITPAYQVGVSNSYTFFYYDIDTDTIKRWQNSGGFDAKGYSEIPQEVAEQGLYYHVITRKSAVDNTITVGAVDYAGTFDPNLKNLEKADLIRNGSKKLAGGQISFELTPDGGATGLYIKQETKRAKTAFRFDTVNKSSPNVGTSPARTGAEASQKLNITGRNDSEGQFNLNFREAGANCIFRTDLYEPGSIDSPNGAKAEQFQGDIRASNQFPDAGTPETGDSYKVIGNVTDNDPAKTNTGLTFNNQFIRWTGSTWELSGYQFTDSNKWYLIRINSFDGSNPQLNFSYHNRGFDSKEQAKIVAHIDDQNDFANNDRYGKPTTACSVTDDINKKAYIVFKGQTSTSLTATDSLIYAGGDIELFERALIVSEPFGQLLLRNNTATTLLTEDLWTDLTVNTDYQLSPTSLEFTLNGNTLEYTGNTTIQTKVKYDGSFEGQASGEDNIELRIVKNGNNTILGGLNITDIVDVDGFVRRISFGTSPDLSSVIVNKHSLTLTGADTQNNSTHKIVAVDNIAKTVDIENTQFTNQTGIGAIGITGVITDLTIIETLNNKHTNRPVYIGSEINDITNTNDKYKLQYRNVNDQTDVVALRINIIISKS